MGKYSDWATKRAVQIENMNNAGAEAMQALQAEPPVSAGIFTYEEWAERRYDQYELFMYHGIPGYVRQAHMASTVFPPFSPGTEALYGARPAPDEKGIYPYRYSMRIEPGMGVYSGKDGRIYRCISPADPLLYDPADVPALFQLEA